MARSSYATKGVDDVQFVADLLEYLKTNYCIDTDRIYASGKSNGAGFVDTLACSDTGDQFAAFAMAAAALYTDTTKESCSKKRAILESHGDSDNTIPYAGGEGSGGPIPNVGKWVRFWGERNCGTGAPSSATRRMDITSRLSRAMVGATWYRTTIYMNLLDTAGRTRRVLTRMRRASRMVVETRRYWISHLWCWIGLESGICEMLLSRHDCWRL